jgi:hypothetical protein
LISLSFRQYYLSDMFQHVPQVIALSRGASSQKEPSQTTIVIGDKGDE